MILTCPNCTTRFLLSAFVLAPDGRKVKCTNCHETWFQLPDPEELNAAPEQRPQDIPDSVKPIPKGSSVPAVRDEEEGGKISALKIAIAAIICLLLLGAILVLMKDKIISAVPTTLPIYKTLGVVSVIPGEGLVFDRLKAEESQNDAEPKIFLSGSIINLTPNDVTVPDMLAEMRDEDGRIVKTVLIKPPLDVLPAEDTMPFEAVFGDEGIASEIYIRFTLSNSASASLAPMNTEEHGEEEHHEEDHSEAAHHEAAPHVEDHHEEPAHSSGHH